MRIQVRVKTIDGRDESFEVDSQSTVQNLRSLITDRLGIPDDRMRLIFQGRHLSDVQQTLEGYGVSNGLVVHVVERPPHLEPLPSSPPGHSHNGRQSLASQVRSFFDNFAMQAGPGGHRPMFATRGRPSFFAREEENFQVHTIVPVLRHGAMSSPEVMEGLVRAAIDSMDHIPQELRSQIDISWRNNNLNIRIPPLNNPYVASPAMERFHVVDSGIRAMRHFRTVSDETTELSAAVDAILVGRPLPIQEHRPQEIATLLEDYPIGIIRRFTEQHPNDFQSPDREARFENGSNFTMRHVLASDMSELLNTIFNELDSLRPHIQRYRAILEAELPFNALTHNNMTSDVNANVLCVYIEHIQRILHRLSHVLHIASDLNVHLEDSLPRRVMPNYVNFQLPPLTRGEVTIQLVEPNGNNATSVANTTPASELLHNPVQSHDAFTLPAGVSPMMTLFPTGFVQQVAVATVTVPMELGLNISTSNASVDSTADQRDNHAMPPPPSRGRPNDQPNNPREDLHPLLRVLNDQRPTNTNSQAVPLMFAAPSLSGENSQTSQTQRQPSTSTEITSEELQSAARMFLSEINPQADTNGNVFEQLFRAQIEQAIHNMPPNLQTIARQSILQGQPQEATNSAPSGNGTCPHVAQPQMHMQRSLSRPFSDAINQAARDIIGQGLGAAMNSRSQAQGTPNLHHHGHFVAMARPPHSHMPPQMIQLHSNPNFRPPPSGGPTPFAAPFDMRSRPHAHVHVHHPPHVHPSPNPPMPVHFAHVHMPPHSRGFMPRPPMTASAPRVLPNVPLPPATSAPGLGAGTGTGRPTPRMMGLRIPSREPPTSQSPHSATLQSLRAANQAFSMLGAEMDGTGRMLANTERTLDSIRNRFREVRERRERTLGTNSASAGASPRPSSGPGNGNGSNSATEGMTGGTPHSAPSSPLRIGNAEVQLIPGGSGHEPMVNEQLVVFDPFLQCNSRFSGRNMITPDFQHSHYQQILANRLPGRPFNRDPPEDYLNLRVPMNEVGQVVALGDDDARTLEQLVRLAVRSIYALMRENDADRASRFAAPVNSILNNLGMGAHGIHPVDEVQVDVHVDGEWIGDMGENNAAAGGIFSGIQGDQISMNLTVPPNSSPAPPPLARRSVPSEDRMHRVPASPSDRLPPSPEIRRVQVENQSSSSGNNSPRPKKRKTDGEDDNPSTSELCSVSSSQSAALSSSQSNTGSQPLPSTSASSSSRIALSAGYQLGLPPHLRSNLPSRNELRELISQLTAFHLDSSSRAQPR